MGQLNPNEMSKWIQDNLVVTDATGGLRWKTDTIFTGTIDIGTIEIDQTTPGTTNGVAPKGLSVDISAMPTATPGTYAAIPIDKNNTAQIVEQGLLDWQLGDNLTSFSPLASSVNTPSIASSATALSANATRQSFVITNSGTNVLYVRLAASASTTVFHAALKACTTNDDGTGGTFYSDEYSGLVSIAGTSPRYVATELTR